MKRHPPHSFVISTIALALTGCVPVNQPALSRSNPADPHAPEAPFPSAAPLLMAGTNYAMAPQSEEQETPHHEHGASLKDSALQGQDQHEHQHEAPKQ